ncbi:MAG: DUF502 domain-containing protein [Acidobacteriota bacterium]|nr:MAG: DUF502 domain-containing protein [Acidobacteriota bacterium]
MNRAWRHLRARLLAGLLFVIPFVATLWVVRVLFHLIDGLLTDQAIVLLGIGDDLSRLTVWIIRVAALMSVVGVLYLLGLAATHVIGRELLRIVEWTIEKIPLLGGVFRAVRQVTIAIGAAGSSAFRRCVLIEYPREGLWTLAFVTNERSFPVGDPPQPSLAVFVPTTPNPTSGYFLLVPEPQCRPLDIPVDDGIKMIVSGGIVGPAQPPLAARSNIADGGRKES